MILAWRAQVLYLQSVHSFLLCFIYICYVPMRTEHLLICRAGDWIINYKQFLWWCFVSMSQYNTHTILWMVLVPCGSWRWIGCLLARVWKAQSDHVDGTSWELESFPLKWGSPRNEKQKTQFQTNMNSEQLPGDNEPLHSLCQRHVCFCRLFVLFGHLW